MSNCKNYEKREYSKELLEFCEDAETCINLNIYSNNKCCNNEAKLPKVTLSEVGQVYYKLCGEGINPCTKTGTYFGLKNFYSSQICENSVCGSKYCMYKIADLVNKQRGY